MVVSNIYLKDKWDWNIPLRYKNKRRTRSRNEYVLIGLGKEEKSL